MSIDITITITVEHSIAPETLSALESLIRAIPVILESDSPVATEPGARRPDGNVPHIETPEHAAPESPEPVACPVRDPDAQSPEYKTCSVCGKPVAQSNESGACRSCSMKRARAKRPTWYHGTHRPRAPCVREQRHCSVCGGNIAYRNQSGLCRICNIQTNRLTPNRRRGLQDIIREEQAATIVKPAALVPAKPFCAHDRDPDTCIHCARMRESGMDTTRPRRNDRADMKPGRKPRNDGRLLLDPESVNEPDLVEIIERVKP